MQVATQMLETSIFVTLLTLQGLKTSLLAYIVKPQVAFIPQIPTFTFLLKSTIWVETFATLLQVKVLSQSIRFTKAPYADAYWFLYSSKLTYATQRTVNLS